MFGLFPGGEDSPPRRKQESKQGGIPASTLQDGLGKMNRGLLLIPQHPFSGLLVGRTTTFWVVHALGQGMSQIKQTRKVASPGL